MSLESAAESIRLARDLIADKISIYRHATTKTGHGIKPLRKRFGCQSVEPTTEQPNSNSSLDCQPLSTRDGSLVEPLGRVRVLRGINVDASMKLPVSPFMPSYGGDSSDPDGVFFDGDNVSFVGRPFPLDTARSHLERIKSLGYNTIRYLLCWEAIEHAGPGIYDTDFADYTISVLRIIHEVGGLYVFLEPHQDVWSRYCGGSGAPMWTLYAAGLEPKRFGPCEAAILHNSPKFEENSRDDPNVYPKMLWTLNYKRLALMTMFTLFFGGEAYFPNLLLNGVNIQEYLQSHYFNALEFVWRKVVEQLPKMIESGAMLGFELLNEPNCGLISNPDLLILASTQHLRIGTTPTAYECFRLGMGFPVEVDNYRISVTGPQKDGSVIVDPEGQRAWLSAEETAAIDKKYGWTRSGWVPGECIFATRGIWCYDPKLLPSSAPIRQRLAYSTSRCTMVKPNFFCLRYAIPEYEVAWHSSEINMEFFTNHFFVEYFIRFKEMVRSVEPGCFILIQPPVLETPPDIKNDPRGIIDDKTIYCPHFYDGLSLMFKSWNTRYNVDTLGIMRNRYYNPVLGIVIGERAIRNCLKKQFIEIKAEGKKYLGNIPVLMSETGMPFDMDGKKAYDDARYHSQTSALDALSYALEGSGMQFTFWCYSSLNCHKWGDRWNNEDFSFWLADDRNLALLLTEGSDSERSSSPLKLSRASSRRSSITPSIKSLRSLNGGCDKLEVLKAKAQYNKNRLLPNFFKKSFVPDADSWGDDVSGEPCDASLISVSSENMTYRYFKQCYPSPDGIRAVNAVMRPALLATLGTVCESSFDCKLSNFILTLDFRNCKDREKLAAHPTIIFVPKWHYPLLSYNDIYLNAGHVKYNERSEYLEWYNCDDEKLVVREQTIILKNNSGKIDDFDVLEESRASSPDESCQS